MSDDIGTRIKEAFGGINMQEAMRLIFGKCPKCSNRMVQGSWLRWCPDRACGYYTVLNRAAGNKINYVKPQTELEEKVLGDLAKEYEVA